MARVQRAGGGRVAALATALALACGDGNEGPSGTSGSIQLTLNPTTLSVPQGGTGSITVSLTRSGSFTGDVTLAVSGLPTGVTTTVNPPQLAGATTSATVTMTAGATVAPAIYTATITATGQGVSAATATHQLTVTAPPAGGTDVEYQYCDASQAPVFFAYQDGTGAWRSVTSSASGGVTRFSFKLTQGRGGVLSVFRTEADAFINGRTARARPRLAQSLRTRDMVRTRLGVATGRPTAPARPALADAYVTELLYATATELAQDGVDNCVITRPTKTVAATVAGVSTGQYGILALGGSNNLFIGGTSTNPVTFADVPTGAVDFVGTRMSPGTPPDKAVLFRNLDIPDGGSLPAPIDFDRPSAIVPASATATITGAAGDELEIFTELVTARSQLLFWFDLAPSKVTARPWAGLRPADMVTGDYHAVVVFGSPPGTEGNFRVALKYVGPVANATLTLGPAISAGLISPVAAGAYPRFRFRGDLPSEYNKGASVDLVSSASGGSAFSIIATSGYLTAAGNALAYDFTMPDVAGLAGFPAAARLTAGSNDASIGAFGFTGPGIFDLKPTLGTEFKAVATTASIVVP